MATEAARFRPPEMFTIVNTEAKLVNSPKSHRTPPRGGSCVSRFGKCRVWVECFWQPKMGTIVPTEAAARELDRNYGSSAVGYFGSFTCYPGIPTGINGVVELVLTCIT